MPGGDELTFRFLPADGGGAHMGAEQAGEMIVLEDVGWATVGIREPPPDDPAAGRKVVALRLDVYQVHDRWVDFHEAHKGRGAADYNEALCDWIVSLGYPRPSHYVAVRFVETVVEQARLIKKNSSPTPA